MTEMHDHLLIWPGPPGITLRLMSDRAAYWPEQRTLFVADVHFGKAAVFRARGLPVPQGTTTATLRRLSRAVARSGAERLVVLGDLLHARESHAAPTMQALYQWRRAHEALDCVALLGNHDLHAGQLDPGLRFQTLAGAYDLPEVLGVHDPADAPSQAEAHGRLVVAGHLHPVARLRGRIDSLRLPCFWLNRGLLNLPAFGEFTGGHELAMQDGRVQQGQAFVIADESVTPWPGIEKAGS